MKAPSPAFSLYPKDLLTDENATAMSDEEFGVYVRALCHAWLEGSIPADKTRLARLLRRTKRSLDRVWPAIEPCFQRDGQRYVNARLEKERAKQAARSEEQRLKGQKGGKSSAANKGTKPVLEPGSTLSIAEVQPRSSLPSPSPSPSPLNGRTEERIRPASPPRGSEDGPRTNPLVQGRRREIETEVLALTRRMAELTGEDPIEVIARAAGYEGALRVKVNPAAMSDDRLANTLRDLRADVAAEEAKAKQKALRAAGGPRGA